MEGSSERTKRAIDAVFGTHTEPNEDVVEDEDEEGAVASEESVDDGLYDDEDPE